MTDARRAWTRRRSRLLLALPVVVAFVVAFGPVGGRAHASDVLVDGRSLAIRGHPTVAAVLTRRHALPHPGRLLDATGTRVLDPAFAPGDLRVNGRFARLTDRVRPGDVVTAANGRDTVEPTELQLTTVTPSVGAPPDVETDLWTAGATGVAVDVVGTHSAEVVGRQILRAPLSAGRVPGAVVALTFDDGPDPRFTPQVLGILRQAGIHAAFCEIGYEMHAFPDLVRAVVDDGNVLCDHTDHHPRLDLVPASVARDEIAGPVAFANSLLGQRVAFVRPPYGAVNPSVVDAAHQQGLRVLGWSVDPGDFQRPPPSVIAARVLAAVHPGAIVLLHDGGGDRTNTIQALPAIISGLRARGYTFTVPSA